MSIWHRFMVWTDRYRLITDRHSGADYLHRYYLFLKDRSWFPFNVTLHKIVRSDDPIFHDHPWGFCTFILAGGYYEHVAQVDGTGKMTSSARHWRGPGSVIWHRSTDMHWLELDKEKPATTLFFMGPQSRTWGFLVNPKGKSTRWVRYDHYLNFWSKYHKEVVLNQPKENV